MEKQGRAPSLTPNIERHESPFLTEQVQRTRKR